VKIEIWRGYHSEEILRKIESAWNGKCFLVLLPENAPSMAAIPTERLRELPEPPVLGLLTSGTMSRKMVLYSKRNLESSLEGIFSFFDVGRIESVFSYPQPYHVFGLALGYLFPLLYGKKLNVNYGPYSRTSHEAWLKCVDSRTLTLGTPTHFHDLIRFVRESETIPDASYSSIVGGASVNKTLWEEMQSVLKIEAPSIGYGASELSPGATHLPPGRSPIEDGEIGISLPNVSIRVDEGTGLTVRGPNVCLAIINGEEVICPSEISLRDEIKVRADGSMVFKHRTDLLLNRGGEKFSLEQIEGKIGERFGIRAVGVGLEHPRLGEELALVVEGDPDRTPVYEFLHREFGREFDPKYFYPIERLPLNGSSKIDRQWARNFVENHGRISH
jgi:acyl-CoA synthetase (AMP-forming)/AMP-acid ligase II